MIDSSEIIYFKERQRFKQWWLWLIFLLIDLFLVYTLARQIVFNTPLDNNPASLKDLLFICLIVICINVGLWIMRLETVLTDKAVYFRFFPIMIKWKKINWNDIETFELLHYHPLRDFGGWGIRFSFKNRTTAYCVSGNRGLFLNLKNGKRIMIGTNRVQLMQEALTQINH